ncbi:hypothetical protein NQ315_017428 [Exocentrus adspersus]|uniref:PiggyBac transposable element-derived protein domain-containing protein n=1 Tax=Exocentrus adspersus TaxID=1586481 RepID=A0AAV8VKF6_9CUCU|nr:hypothetical protein NQ315_017428 [Exocentrus adspersus]
MPMGRKPNMKAQDEEQRTEKENQESQQQDKEVDGNEENMDSETTEQGSGDRTNIDDIEELNRVGFLDNEDSNKIPAEDFGESEDSDTEDYVETRSVDSNTDHEITDDEDIEDEQHYNFFLGQTAKNAKTKAECWNLFFPEDILMMIVVYTNQYIDSVKSKFQRVRDCLPTDIVEIKAFLGLLYLAGVFGGGHRQLADFWVTNGLGIDIFRMAMSEKRFRFLLRCLRFDDRLTRKERRATDKLAAVRDLFTSFISSCKTHYHLGKNVTINEMLLGFRGRCGFRQYIPSKPNKYGIKIFCLSDSKLFYTPHMEIYCGQQPEGPFRQSNSSVDTVMRLSEHIFQSGRNITADNWFTSLEIVKKLENKKLSYVGTIRKNKREIPLTFVSPKGHNTEKKPEIIQFNNSTKSGVDVVDKLCGSYNVSRSIRRREYLQTLGLTLLEDQLKRRADLIKLPRDIKIMLNKKYKESETQQDI